MSGTASVATTTPNGITTSVPYAATMSPHVHSFGTAVSSGGDSANGVSSTTSTSSSVATKNITYAQQPNLPRLPIPSLEETITKFPSYVAALQTPEQQTETRRLCDDFLQGVGPKLQQALLEYEQEGIEHGTRGSYIEEFWNESYLAPDESVVLNLNPFFVLEQSPDPKIAKDQLRRAASLTFASVKLASLLRHETLTPDIFRGKPLCMDQFKVLFGSARQPGGKQVCDQVTVYNDSTHVVVLCQKQFYYFPALWPESGHVAVDEADILDILTAIRLHAAKTDPEEASKTALGVLTSLPRSEWSTVRDELCLDPVNCAALHLIDSALFVLVLDDFTSSSDHALAGNMLHGTNVLPDTIDGYQEGSCLNRWYDKLQLIVCKDGSAGVNFEHSVIDGHTALRFVSDVFAETVVIFAESITALIYGKGRVPHVVEAQVERAANTTDVHGRPLLDVFPKKLLFNLSTFALERIHYAETALCDQIWSCDTHVLESQTYGKSLIVANKLSPDSFVQMSIHLAYYEMYGRLVCGYEPVLTKSYFHGRTEAVRSATPQVKKLCELWTDKAASPAQRLEALREATQEHSRLVKEAAQGKGVDRHLFALRSLAAHQNLPIPEFFHSEAWRLLNHTILSTSNCGNPALKLFGFGPVVHDGFGIGYIIKDNGISYSINSKHRQTARYVRTLEGVLHKLRLLFNTATGMQVSQRSSLRELKRRPFVSTYDDIYGESAGKKDFSMPRESEPSIAEDHPVDHHRGHQADGSFFSTVNERTSSVRLLDLPKIHINLKLDGEELTDEDAT